MNTQTLDDLERLADLLRQHNRIDREIADLTKVSGRGAVGEWIAKRVFKIELADSRREKTIDGYFAEDPFKQKSVNIKWIADRDEGLDMVPDRHPDFYLVLSGPPGAARRGPKRPWVIAGVYLFKTETLRPALKSKVGISTSITRSLWEAAMIYPDSRSPLLRLSDDQRAMLRRFDPGKVGTDG